MKKPKTRSWSSVKKATKKGKKKGKLTKEDRKKINESVVSVLEAQLTEDGSFPPWTREWKFCETRKWRVDFAWPELGIGVECHGSTYSISRHTTGPGFAKDREKMNMALEMGYRIFEYDSIMVKNGEVIEQMKRVIGNG